MFPHRPDHPAAWGSRRRRKRVPVKESDIKPCKGCERPIIFARTARRPNVFAPYDASERLGGGFVMERDPDGRLRATFQGHDKGRGFVSHFVDCPEAGKFGKRAKKEVGHSRV
jgi:hypothetical protein